MIWRLALFEWQRTRAGLMYWLLLAIGQLMIAWLLFAQLEAYARIGPQLNASGSQLTATDLVITPTLGSLVLVLLLSAPMMAQGGFAGERRNGRLPLWLGAPLSTTQLLVARSLGLFLSLLPLLASASLTIVLAALGIDVDVARLVLSLAVLLLFGLWLSALLIAFSTLVEHPAAVLALSYAVLVFVWLLDSFVSEDAGWRWLALLPHVEPAFGGLFRTQDLAYFIITGGAALAIGVFGLARWRGEL
jgi:ABC-2 type transport system permease protein